MTRDGVPISRIFNFGYRTITVERSRRDDKGHHRQRQEQVKRQAGTRCGASRHGETCREDFHEYFKREVLPHVPDAWIDEEKTEVGYEIPFNRHFYVFKPPRPLSEIDAELKIVTDRS